MGRGGPGYLSYTALVLLSYAVGSSADSIWHVSIDESPAPPPDEGPPFSANASRNLDLLPFQIIGIVGAYIGSLLIIGGLLLTVGRSLRKSAQEMAMQPKEMVQPLSKTFERSPRSPGSGRNWWSPRRLGGKQSSGSMRSPQSGQSPAVESVASFDSNVIEADKLKRQQEMERLYAAVMAQDQQRGTGQQGITALPSIGAPERPPEYSTKGPPKIITDNPTLKYMQAANANNVHAPLTPKSPVRAIYPPDSDLPPGPSSPTSPIRAEYAPWPRASARTSDRTDNHAREHSFSSAQTAVPSSAGASTSPPYNQKKFRKSIRNLKISAPIVRLQDDDDARTPLSPRFYADPGIPPEPPTAGTSRSYGYTPATPATAASQRSYGYPPGTALSTGEGDGWDGYEDQIEEYEQMDEVRSLPLPNPQRIPAGVNPYVNEAQMVTDLASTRPDPSRSRPAAATVTARSNVPGSLPLREMNRQYALQQQQQQAAQQSGQQRSPTSQQAAFPLSPTHWNNQASPSHAYVTSAGPVKTTFLEARKDKLRGPITGIPTPYSAYMPFTPVTPITPHLTTRAERKQKQKDERRMKKAIVEEDQVTDEKELWSYAY